MGRKILFITTDQQRFDSLGCNGGTVARTPTIDALAAQGINYTRAHPQSVVCMPSRSTMITGQHVATHGVWMNGVALPVDAPSIALDLWRAGYRTALVGKASPRTRCRATGCSPCGAPDPTARPSRIAASSTWSSPPTARPGHCTMRSGCASSTPR
jgi:Sulfatase